jgi:hypothetical protein
MLRRRGGSSPEIGSLAKREPANGLTASVNCRPLLNVRLAMRPR